jgi:hypothetical protein
LSVRAALLSNAREFGLQFSRQGYFHPASLRPSG